MKRFVIFLSFFAIAGNLSGQITGNSPVASGSQHTYTYSQRTLVSPSWQVNGGTKISESSGFSSYSVTVQWGTSVSSGSVTLFDNSTFVASKTVSIQPSAPTATSATSVRSTSFYANWNSVSGASSYTLEVSVSSSFSTILRTTNNISGTSQVVVNLNGSTAYYYRVRAVNGGGSSANSNTISVTTTPPVPVINPSTGITTTSFTANWNSVASATSYRLDVSSSSDFISKLTGYDNLTLTGTSQVISNLNAGTDYYFRVRAVGATGTSDNPTTPGLTRTLTDQPASMAASNISSTSFAANWSAVTGADSYQLDVSTSSAFGAGTFVSGYENRSVTATSEVVTPVNSNTTYYYRVRGYNSSGSSANSATQSQLTLTAAPNVSAATGFTNTSFTANWSSVTGASSYRLDVATTSTFTAGTFILTDVSVTGTSHSVTTLSANTSYYYRVRGINATGPSANSATQTVKTLTVAPTANAATGITSTGFTANWGAVAGATSYELDVSTSSTFASGVTTYSNITTTTYSVSSLSASTTYHYRVRANNGWGVSTNSGTQSLLTLTASPAVSAASGLTSNSFVANWSGVAGATSYRLDVATTSTFTAGTFILTDFSVAGTSNSVTTLTANTSYYYRVRGINATGPSANSATQTVKTLTVAPTASAATGITSTGFTANWVAATGAVSYELDVSTSSTFASGVSLYTDIITTSFSLTGLSGGTTYYYRVRTDNGWGPSTNSGTQSALTIPSSPGMSAADQLTATTFRANWQASTGATSYRLDVSTSSAFSTMVSGYSNLTVSGTNAVVSDLTANTTYYYRVRAINATGVSANSTNSSALTAPNTPTAAEASSVSSTSFAANWLTVSGASSYRLDVSRYSDFSTLESGWADVTITGGTTSTKAVTGLLSSTTYYYRVRAVNSASTVSTNSNSETVLTTPSATTASTATSVRSTSLYANWSAVTGATSYELDVSTSTTFSPPIVSSMTGIAGTTQLVGGLSANQTYYFRVRAVNGGGESANSNTITVTTCPVPPVISTSTAVSTTSFTANWASVAGATAYKLDISTASSFSTRLTGYDNLNVTSTSQAVSGLSAGTTYYVRVRAVVSAGTTDDTSTPGITKTLTIAPTSSLASGYTSTSFYANWSSVTGAESYQLDVSTSSSFAAGTFVTGYENRTVSATNQNVTPLNTSATYYYRVRGYNSSGSSANSATQSALTLTASPAVSAASGLTSNSFTANWSSVTGASSYRLDVATTSAFTAGTFILTDVSVTGTSHSVTTLTANTSYYYRVRGINATGPSANSATQTVKTLTVAPTASAATGITSTGFTANWGAVTGATSYELDVSTSSTFASGVTTHSDITTTNYSLSSLSTSTTYYYRVRANNGWGVSTNSGTQSLLTLTASPAVFAASGLTSNSFVANWSGVTGATSYRLDVATTSAFTAGTFILTDVSVTGTSHSVTTLTANTAYYYRVRGINATGPSANSATQTVMTLTVAPTASAATGITSTGFTANWVAATGAESYELDVSTSSTFASGVSLYTEIVTTSFSVTGLSGGTTYYYRVRADNGWGPSTNSGTQSALTIPSAPGMSAADQLTATTFRPNWQASTGASSYRLDVSTSSAFSTMVSGYSDLAVSGTNTVVSGLTANTTYYYRVRAVNATGTSANSASGSALTAPIAPTAAEASLVTSTSFNANWSTVSGASSYRLDVSRYSNFSTLESGWADVTITGGTTSTKAVTGLLSSTTYYYRVRAVNGASTVSTNSNSETVLTTPSATTASAASSVRSTSLYANWSAVTGGTSYEVDVSTSTTFSPIVSSMTGITGTTHAVSGLSANQTYYYRLRAVNGGGESANSNTITVTTCPVPPAINVSTAVSTTSFTANWASVAGATSYKLDVSTASSFSTRLTGYDNLNVTSTSQGVSGLSAGTTYYVRVRAVVSAGTTDDTSTPGITKTLTIAPTSSLASGYTSTSFYANWSSVTGAESYQLDVSTSSSFAAGTFVTGYENRTVSATNQNVTPLNTSATYYYRVRGYNSSGSSANSATQSALTLTASPAASAASGLTSSSFTANWSSVTGATSYRLDVATTSTFTAGTFILTDVSVTGTSHSVTTLTANTSYYYRVRGINATGPSANSATQTVKTLTVAPTASAATGITSTGFTANWGAVTGATSYELDVSTSSTFASGATTYSNITTTNYSVSSLSASTTYHYRVRANNGWGVSTHSGIQSLLTLTASPAVSAANGLTSNSFVANWSGVTGATSYRLDVATTSTFTAGTFILTDFSVAGTSNSVTTLTANTSYYYRVRGINATGPSANSATQTVKTLTVAPTASAATGITSTGFTANWLAVTGAVSYELDVSASSTFASGVSLYTEITTTSFSVTGRSSGTTYYYRVRADNGWGPSTNSAAQSALTIPSAPGMSAADQLTATTFRANWQASTGASSYRLDVSTSSAFSTMVSGYSDLTVSGTTTVVSGLTANTTYYYRVRASNATGSSSNSSYSSALTSTNPPEAADAGSITSTSFVAWWEPLIGVASSYRIDVSRYNDFSIIEAGWSNVLVDGGASYSKLVTGLSSNTTYFYRVRAINSGSTPSANSNTISVLTLPQQVTASNATGITTSSFIANWQAGQTDDYELDLSLSSSFSSYVLQNVSVNGTSYTISASSGETYFYRVRVVNSTGGSVNSNVITVVMPPARPTIKLATQIGASSFQANWESVPYVTGYRIDVSTDASFSNILHGLNNVVVAGTSRIITNLSPGSNYYYRVRAENLTGPSDNSKVMSVSLNQFVGQNENYVVTDLILVPGATTTTMVDGLTSDERTQSVQYFDGLGRLKQSVISWGSPSKTDLVQPVVYDQLGRAFRTYLPVAIGNNGWFKVALLDQNLNYTGSAAGFYHPSQQYNAKVKSDAAPYSEVVFDGSPLDKIIEKGSEGAIWQPNRLSPQDGKTHKFEYTTNVDGLAMERTTLEEEKIARWTLQEVLLNGDSEFIPIQSGYYPSGSLYVTVKKDEDNHVLYEYNDKEGRLILKRNQVEANAALNETNKWTFTYYIYDDYARLRFILQPKFLDRFASYVSLSDQGKRDMLDSLSFEYRYDALSRLTYKKVPGSSPLFLVYDKWDRLVVSQDGNQRAAGKWTFTKYDQLDRPIMVGEISNSSPYNIIQAQLDAGVNRFEQVTTGNGIGYTLDRTYPTNSTINDVMIITYYDDYSFLDRLGLNSAPFAHAAIMPPGFTGTPTQQVKGSVTGTKIRVLDSSPIKWQVSATYFDNYHRELQVVSDDILDNINRTTNEYFGLTQRITKTKLDHGVTLSSLLETDFDHQGRVEKSWLTINNGNRVLTESNSYNEVGQLVEQNVHSVDGGTTFLQSNDYRYNIRGWLTHVNNSGTLNDGIVNDDANDLFGMELKYNEPVAIDGVLTTPLFNGNISAMQWKSNSLVDNASEKIYGFTYDLLNRLSHAKYAIKNGATWSLDANTFNEQAAYDKNGNITALTRSSLLNGLSIAQGGTAQNIDELWYAYKGNRLEAVNDNSAISGRQLGFSEDIVLNSGEYGYDANGNIKFDLNKGIVGPSVGDPDGVLYNNLNQPREIRIGDKKILYTYDANGNKLRKVAYDAGGVEISRTTYSGDIVYEGQPPQITFIQTSNGRIVKIGDSWNFEYFHKDHVGNVRVVYGHQDRVDSYESTMEIAAADEEEAAFDNVGETRAISIFNHTPSTTQTLAPDRVSELNGAIMIGETNTPRSIGPNKVLQVAAGDRVQLEVFARYQTGAGSNEELIPSIANAVTGAFGLGAGEAAYTALNDNLGSLIGSFSRQGSASKAYLFYILLNSNHEYYGQFGYSLVEPEASVNTQRLYLDITIPQGGYLYTFVANESNVSQMASVYFDDFTVIHSHNSKELQVLQTSDYYPFGLTFNDNQRANSVDNKKLFNGYEKNEIFGLEVYESRYRTLDPTIARWWQLDPKPTHEVSLFAEIGNNPIQYTDPLGDTTWLANLKGEIFDRIVDGLQNEVHYVDVGIYEKQKRNRGEGETNDQFAKRVRDQSYAFIGENTIKDMRGIVEMANDQRWGINNAIVGREIAFVGLISESGEIRLRYFPPEDKVNLRSNILSPGLQVDEYYPSYDQQAYVLFLYGHVHHIHESVSGLSESKNAERLARPSLPDDFVSTLRGEDGARRQHPVLIATPYGFTLYGAGPRNLSPNEAYRPFEASPGSAVRRLSYGNFNQKAVK